MNVPLPWQTLVTVDSWRPSPLPACAQVQGPLSKTGVFAEAPTMDSDPGAAGRPPQGVLSQAGVGAVVLRQGVLDVELNHASLTGGVRVLHGLLCGGSTGGLRPGGTGTGRSPVLSRLLW